MNVDCGQSCLIISKNPVFPCRFSVCRFSVCRVAYVCVDAAVDTTVGGSAAQQMSKQYLRPVGRFGHQWVASWRPLGDLLETSGSISGTFESESAMS